MVEAPDLRLVGVIGGSWAGISGVISPLIWLISIVTLIVTPFITTHEPPSRTDTYFVSHKQFEHVGIFFENWGPFVAQQNSTAPLTKGP